MTSDKRGLMTARRWRRLIGSGCLGVALLLIFGSAAFSAAPAIQGHAGVESARASRQTRDAGFRNAAGNYGGVYYFLQGGKTLIHNPGDPREDGTKASIAVTVAPDPQPNSCVLYSSLVEAFDSQGHALYQLEAGLAKCGVTSPGLDEPFTGTLPAGRHGCPGLVNGMPHLFKFVETWDGGNDYNCYQQGAANVGSYYTVSVQRTGAYDTTWEASFDNGATFATDNYPTGSIVTQDGIDPSTDSVYLREWGEATSEGPDTVHSEDQCTGVWEGYANFKDWKKYNGVNGWGGLVAGEPDIAPGEPDQGYYRNPTGCNSVTGGTDWVIDGLTLNSGTTNQYHFGISRDNEGGGGCAVRRPAMPTLNSPKRFRTNPNVLRIRPNMFVC